MKDPADAGPTTGPSVPRRSFLASAAAVTAGFTIVPRHVLGGQGTPAPSDKLNIACVGVGGMGKDQPGRCETENIVALCDVDFALADPVFKKYPSARQYKDFRVMLDEQKEIDAVIVATPDHSHAVIAMAAMERKKHVYVQKPLTHSVHEARLLTETARKHGVATQMGNQGHSGEGARLLCEWVWDGAIGDVREAHAWTNRPVWPSGIEVGRPTETPDVPPGLDWDLWLGPAASRPYHPTYHPAKWRAWWDFGTGSLGDMACHVDRSAVLGAEAQVPGQRRGEHLQALARLLRADGGEERDVPPVDDRALQVPGSREDARGRRHVVGRGPDAGAPGRTRTGSTPGQRRRRDPADRGRGRHHGRLLRRVAAHRPGIQDEEVQAAAAGPWNGSRTAPTVTSRTGSAPARGASPPAPTSTTPGPCPRRS